MPLHSAPSRARTLALAAACGLIVASAAWPAEAAGTVKPRFVLLIDTSGSMAQTGDNVNTHGDGSKAHPGCDIDGNGKYDDSKLFQAKAALNETLAAFGATEFALARYRQEDLGQSCTSSLDCARAGLGANACLDGLCAFNVPGNSPNYDECSGGANGCVRCADPDNDPTHVWYYGGVCCPATGPRPGGFGLAGDVIVGFPGDGANNLPELLSWIDGEEDFPRGKNKELRASGTTPIGGSLYAVRDWLTRDQSSVGAGSGVINRDDKIDCRSYNVILLTDGVEVQQCVNNCGIDGVRAADLLLHSCTNGGQWSLLNRRCELNGSPDGTREVRVKTYVVGYAVDDPRLNSVAAAGGTGVAVLARNQAELTARLGDIVSQSLPSEKCDCQDNTCDGLVDETFQKKGEDCAVGVGRCKRQGRLGCKADGSGLVCSSDAPGTCPASELLPGSPVMETCGIAPGCDAPTAADCADDDCDGFADEDMSCACAATPELCDGKDNDCNGKVDDVPPTRCGADIGECRAGLVACVDDGMGGKKSTCMGGSQPTPELCDGKDNDCDGIVDGFALGCYPPSTEGCKPPAEIQTCAAAPVDRWTCEGVCRPGLVTCSAGRCGDCKGQIVPSREVACDNQDNDCDGETDEGFGIGGACGPGTTGVGPCRPGVLACIDGVAKCVGGVGPKDESCNGVDDDCDGAVDNIPGTCGVARGDCRPGKWRCEGPDLVCEQPQGPRAEKCDGRDNDCNGLVDDAPSDPELRQPTMCGASIGVCRPGLLKCIGGGLHCEGGVEPSLEACNGLDDDCDGESDEGVNPPGPCPPPGLAPGTPIRGECRPGMNTCLTLGAGAMWTCVGGTGPEPELCNGKDDDCDGDVDDGATCPDGQGCADAECVPRCTADAELACPSGRICRDGLCRLAACVLKPCSPGLRCDLRRGCVDRCDGVSCPSGTRCEAGECMGCLLQGCPTGLVCRSTGCAPNPCAGKVCPRGSYCRDGSCVKSCEGVACRAGQRCVDGACVPDKCGGRRCAAGDVCNPADGRCRPDPCPGVQCLPGQVCVQGEGTCAFDPCAVTACPVTEVCIVLPGGEAVCRPQREVFEVGRVTASGGAGCGSCTLGAASSEPSVTAAPGGGAPWLLVGLALARLARRRRAEASRPLTRGKAATPRDVSRTGAGRASTKPGDTSGTAIGPDGASPGEAP
jgi:hypothetical protein